MKEVVLRIEDSAFDNFMGMVRLCPQVEVVSDGQDDTAVVDDCLATAVLNLQQRGVFRRPSDYGYVMKAVNENALKGAPFFYSPMQFIDYLNHFGVKELPGKSTIYSAINKVEGKYPNWTFTDNPTEFEALRRNNIVRQLISAFGKAHLDKLERRLENR